ncbi:putative ribosomal protein S27 [Helianthus annuus]|nr:putative ribosomal protein S27 [Helianthus annuus]
MITIFTYLIFLLFWVYRTTVFSHSQTVVVCGNCQTVLCQPTGGRARLTEGCSFRRKGD